MRCHKCKTLIPTLGLPKPTGVKKYFILYVFQVARSEGLILVYKFEDGILTSSHSRLKHTDINLSPSIISSLESLILRYVKEHFEENLHKEKVPEGNEGNISSLLVGVMSVFFLSNRSRFRRIFVLFVSIVTEYAPCVII